MKEKIEMTRGGIRMQQKKFSLTRKIIIFLSPLRLTGNHHSQDLLTLYRIAGSCQHVADQSTLSL